MNKLIRWIFITLLQLEWPFLFEATHLFNHASRLLGFEVLQKLAAELSQREIPINNFLLSKGKLLHKVGVYNVKLADNDWKMMLLGYYYLSSHKSI